jgi:hypothetical protein
MMELGARLADIENPVEAVSLHSSRMVLNEEVLESGIAMYAAMALTPHSQPP